MDLEPDSSSNALDRWNCGSSSDNYVLMVVFKAPSSSDRQCAFVPLSSNFPIASEIWTLKFRWPVQSV